jgi:YHS domain-containing protein
VRDNNFHTCDWCDVRRLAWLGCGRFVGVSRCCVNTADGLALKGYDPVAYFTDGQPTKGADQYSFQWKGVTCRFASAENLKRFKADPEKYLPQYGGYCAYAMSLDRIADIDPHRWAIVGGKLYLNNDFLAQNLWSLNKSGNIASADRNWPLYPKKAADK